MSYQLRCGGVWLNQIAPWGGLSVSWTWGAGGGGVGVVDWQMSLPPDFDHIALRRGSLVEVMDGGTVAGLATINQPGRTDDGLEFHATGIQRDAEHYLSFDGTGASTSTPDTAVDQAIARGLRWNRPDTLSAVPLVAGDVTQGLNYLSDLLNALTEEAGNRWYVDGSGAVRLALDPTTPTWQIVPGVADFVPADDDYATALFGRYIEGGTSKTATSTDLAMAARFGRREYGIDLTMLGGITTARADARLAGLRAHGKASLSLADRIEVTRDQLLTFDGTPAPLSMVRAGHMVRAYGTSGDVLALIGAPYVDFVLGEVTDNDDGVLTLAPIDLAPRSLADRLAVTPRRVGMSA